MGHPEDLCQVVHPNVLQSPIIKLGSGIIVLVAENMSRGPCERAGSDHLAKSAKKIKVRISGFKRPCVETLVESQESITANLDTARSKRLTTSTMPCSPASSLRYAPWLSGCPGTRFRLRIEQLRASRMVNAEDLNLSSKDPSLIAREVPSCREARTGLKLRGRSYS
jgi:hypothetical protein